MRESEKVCTVNLQIEKHQVSFHYSEEFDDLQPGCNIRLAWPLHALFKRERNIGKEAVIVIRAGR